MILAGLLAPEVPVAEKIIRAVVVYLFLLAAFRFTGKRQVGQLTPFDLVVLLIISNVVQNAVIGPDNSLGGGLLGAVVILILRLGLRGCVAYERAHQHDDDAAVTGDGGEHDDHGIQDHGGAPSPGRHGIGRGRHGRGGRGARALGFGGAQRGDPGPRA